MSEDKKTEPKKDKKPNLRDIKITGIDIDKAEYQEIVLSQSNFPDSKYGRSNY